MTSGDTPPFALHPLARAIKVALYSNQPARCIIEGCTKPAVRNGVYGPVCFDHVEFGGLH